MKVFVLTSGVDWGGGGQPLSIHRSEEGAELKKDDPVFREEGKWSQRDVNEMDIQVFELED